MGLAKLRHQPIKRFPINAAHGQASSVAENDQRIAMKERTPFRYALEINNR